MCLLAYISTEGIHHSVSNSRSLAPFVSIILWQAAANAGFAYSNYVTTARTHPFVGLHGGFRDLITVNALVPVLAFACTSTTGITHHLFPTDEVRGITNREEARSVYSRLFGSEDSSYKPFEESVRSIPLWHRVWLDDKSELVTLDNYIDDTADASEVTLHNYESKRRRTMSLSFYEYFYEDKTLKSTLQRQHSTSPQNDVDVDISIDIESEYPDLASFGMPQQQKQENSEHATQNETRVGVFATKDDNETPDTTAGTSNVVQNVPILKDYERYLSSNTEPVSPFMYLLKLPMQYFRDNTRNRNSVGYPNPFRYRGLCLVLTFLGAFVLGMHTPYVARSSLLGQSVSAKEYASGNATVVIGVLIKVFLVLLAVLHHFRWLMFIPMYHLAIRLAIYAFLFFSIIAITCTSSPVYYLHLHHWAMGLLLLPMAITTSIYWTCFLQGFSLSQFVEGASRWSCAPLWHPAGRNDIFRQPRKSVVDV